jgi:hypothetical protein
LLNLLSISRFKLPLTEGILPLTKLILGQNKEKRDSKRKKPTSKREKLKIGMLKKRGTTAFRWRMNFSGSSFYAFRLVSAVKYFS